jgi:tetratricopeptide (TPR) repeat protein
MTGDLIGTLRYMSPEQALAKRVIIDHRTDIYSLGATLYELLTLRPAYEGNDRQELLRRIAFEEPRPLRRINPRIPAELETIVLKSLEKNPAERYATAKELADDLRRYLQHEPIRAKKPNWMQRVGKWSRRHPAFIRAAVVILFLITVGSLLSTWIIWQEKKQTGKALASEQQARDLAMAALRDLTDDIVQNQMARAPTLTEENKEFLRKIIKHYESFAAITADDAASRSIRAEGYYRVGLMRYRLGEYKEAEAAYCDALAIRKQLAVDYPSRAEFHQDLAKSQERLGIVLTDTGRLEEAEAAFIDALAILNNWLLTSPPGLTSGRVWQVATTTWPYCSRTRAGSRKRRTPTSRPWPSKSNWSTTSPTGLTSATSLPRSP